MARSTRREFIRQMGQAGIALGLGAKLGALTGCGSMVRVKRYDYLTKRVLSKRKGNVVSPGESWVITHTGNTSSKVSPLLIILALPSSIITIGGRGNMNVLDWGIL